MGQPVSGDPHGREIPQSSSRTFDQDLEEILTQNVRQLNELQSEIGEVEAGAQDVPDDVATDDDVARVQRQINRLDRQLDNLRDAIGGDGDDEDERDDLFEADFLEIEGPYPQLLLDDASSGTEAALGARGDGLAAEAETITADTPLIRPEQSYETSLGSPERKFLTVHAAELWIEQLVAQQTRATIGGKVFVGQTSTLTQPLSGDPSDGHTQAHKDKYNYLRVKHNAFGEGDVLMLEARGTVEFVRVASAPATVNDGFDDENPFEFNGGVYRYEIDRDLDGTGANTWFEGDSTISTGKKGSGFIELHAQESMRESSDGDTEMLSGPSMAFSLREEDKSTVGTGTWAAGTEYQAGDVAYYEPDDTLYEAQTGHTSATGDEPLSDSSKWAETADTSYYNEWGERTALGRLDGYYDYAADTNTWGLAAGDQTGTWVSVDDTDGFRLMNQDAKVGQWDTDGTVRVGPYQSSYGAHPVTIDPQGNLTAYGDIRVPDGDDGFQKPANWRGPWATGLDYERGDAVGYDGQTYICRTAHTSSTSDGDNDTAEPLLEPRPEESELLP